MKNISREEVTTGIKECIQNSRILLTISKLLFDNLHHTQATIFYQYSLEEFGKAVLLRDKDQIAEFKNLAEIDISDFFYDSAKKNHAAINTAGPNINIIKTKNDKTLAESTDNSDSPVKTFELMLIDYNYIR